MLGKLIVLFVVVPLVELVLLLVLADLTRWEFTLLLVIFTGAAGIWLARSQGFQTWRRIETELSAGRMPAEALMDAVLILIAGALLLTPGILTDAFGLSLLFPPSRRLYRKWLIHWFKAHTTIRYQGSGGVQDGPADPQIIDSYVVGRPTNEGSDPD